MVPVTAVYERDVQGRWLVHIAEEPRCHTWARSFVSARREINDAAELWIDELGIESFDNLDIRDEVRIADA
jgi:predicted RNase H-like HicB family nuclease